MEIRVQLFGRLEQNRFRRGRAVSGDGGVPITLAEAIAGVRILAEHASRT